MYIFFAKTCENFYKLGTSVPASHRSPQSLLQKFKIKCGLFRSKKEEPKKSCYVPK